MLWFALNVIGKAMTCKEGVHEWRYAIDVLNSSSHEFPDYEIKKEELIEYWIHEGFINGKRDEDGSNNHGHAIIGSLVRAHLLMDGQFTTMVKMHDVLREMALWIESKNRKQGENIYVKSGSQLCNIPKDINWKNVRRISLMSNHIAEISCRPKCPKLLTLLLGYNMIKITSGEFFHYMQALVILDLSNNPIDGLPEEISSLSSLQYLNISSTWIQSLPVGLKGLKKLISLDLESNFRLTSIADIGTCLPNLQVLKLFDSGVCIDATLLEELQRLEYLKVLTANLDNALILESIQGTKRMANSIQGLCLQNMREEVVILYTVALSGLQRLTIKDSKILEININLVSKETEELLCTSCPGFKHPSTVYIDKLQGSKDMTWLLFAQNLKYLTVLHSQSIEEVVNREKGMSISNVHPDIAAPFGKLESLEVTDLYGLKRNCLNPSALPNLRQFVVKNCQLLPKCCD